MCESRKSLSGRVPEGAAARSRLVVRRTLEVRLQVCFVLPKVPPVFDVLALLRVASRRGHHGVVFPLKGFSSGMQPVAFLCLRFGHGRALAASIARRR